jgi:hypothetical protein
MKKVAATIYGSQPTCELRAPPPVIGSSSSCCVWIR